MTIPGSARVRRAATAVWREFDGQVAIVSIEHNRVRLLNDVGGFLWKLCDGATIEGLGSAVCAEYAVDPSTAARDVEHFVAELEGRGLVIVERAP